MTKRVRGEVSRYLRRTNIESSRNIPQLVEDIISSYCNHNHRVEYYPAMVNLCAPFVYSVKRECDAFFCFEKIINTLGMWCNIVQHTLLLFYELVQPWLLTLASNFVSFPHLIIDDYYSSRSIKESVASFMTLFRTCIPDLYSFFEEEEVDIKEWAASALQFVLSRELSLENLMRLWDTYFAVPDWIEFHPFFCLAVLKHLKEHLEELEQSEIRTYLMRLPSLEMDQVQILPFRCRLIRMLPAHAHTFCSIPPWICFLTR